MNRSGAYESMLTGSKALNLNPREGLDKSPEAQVPSLIALRSRILSQGKPGERWLGAIFWGGAETPVVNIDYGIEMKNR